MFIDSSESEIKEILVRQCIGRGNAAAGQSIKFSYKFNLSCGSANFCNVVCIASAAKVLQGKFNSVPDLAENSSDKTSHGAFGGESLFEVFTLDRNLELIRGPGNK